MVSILVFKFEIIAAAPIFKVVLYINMFKYTKYIIIQIYIVSWLLWLPSAGYSEYYRYVDKEGRIYYVDELGKVPEAYQDQIGVYREKYDHLPEPERNRALQREHEQQKRLEEEQQHRINEQIQEFQEAEKKEKKRLAEESKKRYSERMQTRVIVDDNRILVPVTLVNHGNRETVHLLLDTGASQIVLHREVANRLNIVALNKGLAKVAGGHNIYVELGEVDSFRVGPFEMPNANVLIIAHEGEAVSYNGLLGMNFLKNVPHTIDYKKQVIRWQLPAVVTPDEGSSN